MAKWHPIKNVPVNKDIDVWAVHSATQPGPHMHGRRWPDVRLVRRKSPHGDNILEYWEGLPMGWKPTHWRTPPRAPDFQASKGAR